MTMLQVSCVKVVGSSMTTSSLEAPSVDVSSSPKLVQPCPKLGGKVPKPFAGSWQNTLSMTTVSVGIVCQAKRVRGVALASAASVSVSRKE